ncbi:MAG: tyrosine-protein phosphatase [Nitrospiraceae bacterium]|nr:tyrosine-protein phosphatase [Nitrospiraceae bacterium]
MKTVLLLVALLLAGCASVSSTEYIARVDGNLWRGSRQSDLSQLNQFGKVINLEGQNEYVKAELLYADAHGIAWHHYPLSESPFIRPSVETLRAIVADIESDPGVKTFIHCRRGKDRTGFVVALYRVLVDGWEIDAAYEEAVDYGHASLYYAFWKPVLYKAEKGGI